MTIADVVGFARQNRVTLTDPMALGLPDLTGNFSERSDEIQPQLTELLIEGAAEKVRDLLVRLFLNFWSIERIVDEIISPSFVEIGHQWACGRLDIYKERRACEIALAAMRDLRSLINAPPLGAPLAIGGSIQDDHYSLPTFAVELTLASHRWNAVSLGSNLPFHSFREAVKHEKPNLLWLSISHLADDPTIQGEFQAELNQLAVELPPNVAIVVGGHAVSPAFRSGLRSIVVCDNMSQLLASAKNFVPPAIVPFT